jgi:hypothetical protein
MRPTLAIQIPQRAQALSPRQPARPGPSSYALAAVLGIALLGAPLLMWVLATTAVL